MGKLLVLFSLTLAVHVIEGGYYPVAEIGLGGGGVGVAGGMGAGGMGLGYGGYGGGMGVGGAGMGGAGKFIGGGQYLAGGAGMGGMGVGGVGIGGAGMGAGKFIGGGQYYGGGAGIGGMGVGGAGMGGVGMGAGKFIGGGQYIGGGLMQGGGAGLYGGGLMQGGGAGLIGGGGGVGLIGGGGAGLIGGGAGLMGGGGGGGYIGGPMMHGYGGQFIDKNVYSGEKKNLNDEAFEKATGQKGEQFNGGNEGFSKGVAAVKNNKGESAYFNNAAGGKKIADDGKTYYGGQHFDKEGKHGGQFNEKKGHKKGHVIKGFKSSHHKDETGNTEEFYDNENDEGGNVNFNGQAGSFGEKSASSAKGGHENGEFAEGAQKKQGHFDNEHLLDNSNVGHGNFGEKKYGGSGSVHGVNNGIDQRSLLGHQENSKFYKHMPFY